jgi:exodeoxyribonuclease VII small subunit
MNKNIALGQLLEHESPLELLKELNFEQGMNLLEELCSSIESGALSLDVAVESYERGIMVMNHLQDQLSKAESRIRELGGESIS